MFFNVIFGFILGIVLGSLIGVLVERSLSKTSFFGRSKCDHCHKKIKWYDLFPLVSFLILKGKCRYCHKKIKVEFFLTELVFGILLAYLFFQNPVDLNLQVWPTTLFHILELIFKGFVLVVLTTIFLTDIRETIIPDRIIIPSIVIAFISLLLLTGYKIYLIYWALINSEIGRFLLPPHTDYLQRHSLEAAFPLLSGLIMAFVVGLFFLGLIVITKGRGMGGGDFKFGIFLGLVFGFPQSLLVLLLSFLMGSVVGVILILVGKKNFGQTIPFGPFLSLGGVISLFWGQQILDWYLKLRLN